MPSVADLRSCAFKGVTFVLLELALAVETAVDLVTIKSILDANTIATRIGIGESEMDLKGAVAVDLYELGDSILLVGSLVVGVFRSGVLVGNDLDLEAGAAVENGHVGGSRTVVERQ